MLTEEDFKYKIDSEGGIFEALSYGLGPEDVEPGEVRDAWARIHDLFWDQKFQDALSVARDRCQP